MEHSSALHYLELSRVSRANVGFTQKILRFRNETKNYNADYNSLSGALAYNYLLNFAAKLIEFTDWRDESFSRLVVFELRDLKELSTSFHDLVFIQKTFLCFHHCILQD